ncbi:MAG: restriction endonuclease subunit S [Nitrospira sp.]|nr:restriction endonuclease subunit S [Nitrospira sp.]
MPLGEILTERREVPSGESIAIGEIQIIAKIGFEDGRIQLRRDGQTKTGMILIRPGDLVISGINASKGAIAIYGEENSIPIAATIHYAAYVPNKKRIDVRFLWYLLRSRNFRELLFQHVPGGIKAELKAKRLLPVPIPLPSSTEQRRIVERIDALVDKIEEVRNLQQQTKDETGALEASIITYLLAKTTIDGSLSDVLLEKPKNGWSAKCDNLETGTPVLTLGAVTGFQYRQNQFKRTSEPVSLNAYCWLKKGDLLITRSNTPELVGHAAIYNGLPSPCVYPDLMMRLATNNEKANKQFVHLWLRSTLVRDYIKSSTKGTSSTMRKITQDVVMKIPFPSKLEISNQLRLVTYMDSFQAKIDVLKEFQQKIDAKLNALLPSILDRAFKGRL